MMLTINLLSLEKTFFEVRYSNFAVLKFLGGTSFILTVTTRKTFNIRPTRDEIGVVK